MAKLGFSPGLVTPKSVPAEPGAPPRWSTDGAGPAKGQVRRAGRSEPDAGAAAEPRALAHPPRPHAMPDQGLREQAALGPKTARVAGRDGEAGKGRCVSSPADAPRTAQSWLCE